MSEDASMEGAELAGLSIHDIQPNVYEGGFKTWECSIDLARYLARNKNSLSEQSSTPHFVTIEVCGEHIPWSNVVSRAYCELGSTDICVS